MKKTRFTEEQMVTILREADEKSVPEVAKKHGVNAQTLYAWRKHFGSLEPTDVKRLRQLEQENGRLKKMVADGVMTMAPAADGTSYQEYQLTEKGEALLPVLVAVRQWGERFLFAPGEPHPELVDKHSGKTLEKIRVRDVDGQECGVADLELVSAS